jgi:hypothetical protein
VSGVGPPERIEGHPPALSSWTLRALAAAAVLLSLVAIAWQLEARPLLADGQRYREMTQSLWAHGEFRTEAMTMASPQVGESERGFTHYFSPLWPVVMLPFYLVMGPLGFDVAYVAACAAALLAAWTVTRRMHGDGAALGLVAVEGVWLHHMAVQRATEPLALFFFVIMLWAILRSTVAGQGRWILLAGAMAALAYLTRASVGWLFLLGGAAGFAWRIFHHRKGALNPYYLGAIAIFGAGWALWALRNLARFWDGTLLNLPHALASDAVFEHKFSVALAEPWRLVGLTLAKLAWGLVLLSPVLALRGRYLWHQVRHLADERESGRFLTWSVPIVLGAVVGAVFTIADTSPPHPLLSLDNLRYFVFALPGLFWGPWLPQNPDTRT